VLSVLLAASKKAQLEGHRLELLVPGGNTGISSILQVSGIETLISVRRVPVAAEAPHSNRITRLVLR
jgi:hypothetical protein